MKNTLVFLFQFYLLSTIDVYFSCEAQNPILKAIVQYIIHEISIT